MTKINLNRLASAIAACEGKKKETDIAQIKECIRCTFIELRREMERGNTSGVLDAIERSAE